MDIYLSMHRSIVWDSVVSLIFSCRSLFVGFLSDVAEWGVCVKTLDSFIFCCWKFCIPSLVVRVVCFR